MSQHVRSRRAGLTPEQARRRPLYARVLGLQYLDPSGLLCFLYFEGAIALGVLVALAELAEWWVVLVLPATIAVMVKINDVVKGALVATGGSTTARRAHHDPERHDPDPRDVPGARVAPEAAGGSAPAEPDQGGTPTWALRQVSREPVEDLDAPDSPRQRFRQSANRRYGG